MLQPNYVIVSGPPGSGKTATLAKLARHYPVIAEPARRVLAVERASQGTATGDQDAAAFVHRMAALGCADYSPCRSYSRRTVLFDRGLPDLLGFCAYYNLPRVRLRRLCHEYRYNCQVFWLASWPKIYCQDSERRLDVRQAYFFGEGIRRAYLTLGYQIITVPQGSIQQRAAFIRQQLETTIHPRRSDGGVA